MSSDFCLSSQGHQVASAVSQSVRLCSRHVMLVALRDDEGRHLYYTYTCGHIFRSVSLLWTVRRYRKMKDKTQSRNSQEYTVLLWLLQPALSFCLVSCRCRILRTQRWPSSSVFQMQMWRICLICMVGLLSLSRLCPKIRRLCLKQNSTVCNWTISVESGKFFLVT